MTWLFRGAELEGSADRTRDFDPVAEGHRYRLAPSVSLAIWDRVGGEATDRHGQRDEQRARQRFHRVAARVAARGGRLQPDPGRMTRHEGYASTGLERDVFADPTPGRTTLAVVEAQPWERGIQGIEAITEGAALPHHGEVNALIASMRIGRADGAERPSLPVHEDTHAAGSVDPAIGAPTRLDNAVAVRMSRLFGVDLTHVDVVPGSPAATGSTQAVTRNGEVHFRAGAYQPGTPTGDWLIAHELAHVVQQRGGFGERAGTRNELEHEADRAARSAILGRAARISLRAQPTAAYAFNEAESHDGLATALPSTDTVRDARADVNHAKRPVEPHSDEVADRVARVGLTRGAHDAWTELGTLHATGGPAAVQTAVQALDPDPRVRFGALLGVDLSFVQFERGAAADQFLDEIGADGAAVGATVYVRAGLSAEQTWELEAHELTHVAQTGGDRSDLANDWGVAPPDSAVEREAEVVGQQLAAFQPLARPLAASAPAGTVLRGKGKIVGWLIKVGERKLIKTTAIYSEKELANLLGKGFNVLVRDGRQAAKRIAKKVWGEEVLHHTGHIIRKTGKLGLSHFQPLRHGVGRAGEKGWHIFYSALPILFFSEDADAMVIYEDKYPGKSVANYLTVTQYAGKDSWLSYLDWINPLELIAIGGDIGREWDRERTKEIKSLIFTRQGPNGTIQTYELDPEGQLIKVYVQGPKGEKQEFTAEQYQELLGNAADGAAVESDPPLADGTTDPNYAGTFDAEYRIYHSKQGWNWVAKTRSFFLPAEDAAKLTRVGSFYVNYNARAEYLYVLVHPSMRSALHQPGFKIPPDLINSYFTAENKEQFLQNMMTSALTSEMMRTFDPSTAK